MVLGWIYVLSQDAMPGIVKIGQSAADPVWRAQQLQTTGVPGSFYIEYKGLFEGFEALEGAVHRKLSDHRITANREFFKISPAAAVLAIKQTAIENPKYEVITFTENAKNNNERFAASAPLPWEKSYETKHVLNLHNMPKLQKLVDCLYCGRSILPKATACLHCYRSTS